MLADLMPHAACGQLGLAYANCPDKCGRHLLDFQNIEDFGVQVAMRTIIECQQAPIRPRVRSRGPALNFALARVGVGSRGGFRPILSLPHPVMWNRSLVLSRLAPCPLFAGCMPADIGAMLLNWAMHPREKQPHRAAFAPVGTNWVVKYRWPVDEFTAGKA